MYFILMLQEVCCPEKTNSMWSAEWGYIAIFSGVPSNHCGFALPFNIPFSFKIQKSFSLFYDIETDKECFTLGSI